MALPLIPIWPSVRYLLFGLLALSVLPTSGQTLEDVLTTLQLEEDGSILTEGEILLLENLARRPLDLNRVNRKELEEIPLLTSGDVSLILGKRQDKGSFVSKQEILALSGLSIFAKELIPIVTTVLPVVPTDVAVRNRWNSSSGDFRVLTRGILRRGTLDGGFTLERDPGEMGAADFVSGYLALPVGDGSSLIVGDHQLLSGYGLLFGRSIPYIKGYGSLTGMGRVGKGLKPYRSSIERWALRGVAFETTGRPGQWIVSLFPGERMALLSWQKSQEGSGTYGITVAQEGSSRRYGSLYGSLTVTVLQFFGEVAVYSKSSSSFFSGVLMAKDDLKWISSLRRYPAGFQGPRAQPFREWTGAMNESGIYQAVSLKMGKHRLHSYGDVYWQSSTVNGFETATTWIYRSRGEQISLRWKLKEKSLERGIVYQGDSVHATRKKESLRLSLSFSLRKLLKLQLQGDRTVVTEGRQRFRGHGVSVKTHITFPTWRLSFNWVGFRTDHYHARIYVWDLNLPGELRNRAFFSNGQSAACLFRVATPTGATLSARIRTTWPRLRLEAGFQMDIAF